MAGAAAAHQEPGRGTHLGAGWARLALRFGLGLRLASVPGLVPGLVPGSVPGSARLGPGPPGRALGGAAA